MMLLEFRHKKCDALKGHTRAYRANGSEEIRLVGVL